MNRLQEKRLIKKCLQNDALAQRMLYERFKNGMYTVALRITNNSDEAHDALQEAFIEVFKNLEKFRGLGSLGGWIKVIVIRSAIKVTKGLHLHVELEEDRVQLSEIRFDENLTGELLEKLIKQLPGKSRVVFSLIEVEGYSHKEAADLLGISVGTSKSQLHYAKQILKTELISNGYEASQQR